MQRERVLYSGSCQSTPVLERLAAASSAGFTAMSLWPSDVRGLDLAATRASVSEAGLHICDVELIGNWLPQQRAAPDGVWRAVKWQTPEHVLPVAAALGARTVSAVELFGLEFDGRTMARHFRELCLQAADMNLRIALEFLPTGGIADLAQGWEVVDRADCDNGGLMIDSWHFFRSSSSLAQLASIAGDRIFSVQLSDAAAISEEDMVAGMRNRMIPGQGELDLAGFMQALAATGTQAPIGIEIFSADLHAMPIAQSAALCRDALNHCLALAS